MPAEGPEVWRSTFTAEATYHPTGETYGLGDPRGGNVISASVILEGNANGVNTRRSECWAELKFDLPVLLPLSDDQWTVPYSDTELRVRIQRVRRGEELWSSLDTTQLPSFSRVWIKAVPAWVPGESQKVAEVVLRNVDLLLAITGQKPLKKRQRRRLSLRTTYYVRMSSSDRPEKKPILFETVALTGAIEATTPEAVPLTPEILRELEVVRAGLVATLTRRSRDEPFTEKVTRTIHDFGYYCRQHPGVLGLLQEEQLRDLLLIVCKQLFLAEGEAINYRGKSDLKITNPKNRYEFALTELKIWHSKNSLDELLQQAFIDHVSSQEAVIVAQVFSRNKDFSKICTKVLQGVIAHPAVTAPLGRLIIDGSREQLFRTTARVREATIPFVLSLVDIRHGREPIDLGRPTSVGPEPGDTLVTRVVRHAG